MTRQNTPISAVVWIALLVSSVAHPNTTFAQPAATVTSDLPSGQPVGTPITWTITATGSDQLEYRFLVRTGSGSDAGQLPVFYDFTSNNQFKWTPIDEGPHEVTAHVRDLITGAESLSTVPYSITSRAGSGPTVTATANPLVALYSAPPCSVGLVARAVFFDPDADTSPTITNPKPCQPGRSLNFYTAGMRANTNYAVFHVITDLDGNPVELVTPQFFVTGSLPTTVPTPTVLQASNAQTSTVEVLVLHSGAMPFASDLAGHIVWYADIGPSLLLRPVAGGSLLVLFGDDTLREIDLAGNTLRETTRTRLNEQLAQFGFADALTSLHHEALRLPNGYTAVLGSVERVLEGVQGPGVVDILGDYIIVLDQNFQLVWAWNAFDHLDATRVALLGETCVPGQGGCAQNLLRSTVANDWLHSNSIGYSPTDGNLILSMRHQDWVVKIDYGNGNGTGRLLWRLGAGGDFTLSSDDPHPWFSHQHDAKYVASNRIALYDNGNTRCAQDSSACFSRGQVLEIDEVAMTATLALNVDLEQYSPAVGSAQPLTNGDFHFNSGAIGLGGSNAHAISDEVTADGTKAYSLQIPGLVYRTFRMHSLYGEEK